MSLLDKFFKHKDTKISVILVDKRDHKIGTEEKMEAHKDGKLHRAFSIYVFNKKGEMMLQKRAGRKYHSGGLWTNTVCSHPQPGESVSDAAHRRLREEMGFDCGLDEVFSFIYRVEVGTLIEHEYLHVYFGEHDGKPSLNKNEAADWKWAKMRELTEDIKENPDIYTEWFKIAIKKIGNRPLPIAKSRND